MSFARRAQLRGDSQRPGCFESVCIDLKARRSHRKLDMAPCIPETIDAVFRAPTTEKRADSRPKRHAGDIRHLDSPFILWSNPRASSARGDVPEEQNAIDGFVA